MALSESKIEVFCVKLLQQQGYGHVPPEQQEKERDNFSEIVLKDRLQNAINKLNPHIPQETRNQALRQLLDIATGQDLSSNNQNFHRLFTNGMDVQYRENGEIIGKKLHFVDLENPENNDFVACDQFTVLRENGNGHRRPDIVLFVNGLPLVVIELKNPASEMKSLKPAYNQFQTYKAEIPALFQYNGLLAISDGFKAEIGSLTAKYDRFSAWKEKMTSAPRIEALVSSLLKPSHLLNYLRHFVVFEQQSDGSIEKKIAACHQYRAVNEAVKRTHTASKPEGDRKVGIVWHAQGSGKSLSMVFYSGRVVLELSNPTIVVITDRNDLDDQLFDTFANNRQLLRQKPIQAKSRTHIRELLQTAGGGVIFTTLQKFLPEEQGEKFPLLSERQNIVVIADEAHRSHYGFAAKINENTEGASYISYGFAKHLRDALPQASFIGFTATPVEKEDASTRNVFGDEIDIYDMQESITDGATVPIYYEGRLVKMGLDDDVRNTIDEEVEALIGPEDQEAAEAAKQKWAQWEAIVGNSERLRVVAKDIVEHFEEREKASKGKALIVTMSRRIAVELYEHIIELRPDWHDDSKDKGKIKVVMTASASDPIGWQIHNTTKDERRQLGNRIKDPENSLKLAIVCDMWLTGFDAPCLNTMYIDKLMRGHNLMQAIARVNRIYQDKVGGLIVDYIGFASDLQKAISVYTASGGKGEPVFEQQKAIDKMLEEYEIVVDMFGNFDYKRYFDADTGEKITIILEAQNHILGLEDGKKRFNQHVRALSQAFALSLPSKEALEIRDDVAFFSVIKARLAKFEPQQGGKSSAEIEAGIRQIIDKALIAGEVVDVFDAAGIKKPDLSILSDEFLEQVRNMKHKNLAFELLRKLLNDELYSRGSKNLTRTRKLSEMLDEAIKKYRNKSLTSAEIIDELIAAAKVYRDSVQRGQDMGLSDEEVAFYDALADNKSARDIMGDEKLCALTQVLVEKVRSNVTLDWTIRENARARIRVMVRRILREYGYPPDMEQMAIDNVLRQAEELADEWAAELSD